MLATRMSFPVIFTSSAFYDPDKAPVALRLVASINPLSVLATAVRDALLLGEFAGWGKLLLALVSVGAFIAAWLVVSRTPLIAQDW